MRRSSKGSIFLALLLVLCLTIPTMVFAAVLEGEANVDGRFYPSVTPFVHPPFYNVKVKVETDDAGKVVKVEDNGTGMVGSLASQDQEERWTKVNKPYFDAAVGAGVFSRFDGKTRDEIAALAMNSGEADVISGATLVGLATQEAVLNALDGKAGKQFLPVEGNVMPVKSQDDTTVVLESKLPADFDAQLLDIRYSPFNTEENRLAEDAYTAEMKDGLLTITFKDPASLLPGKYNVNVVDASGTYRNPNFESGHGEEDMAQNPRFVIEAKGAEVTVDGTQIQVTGAELDVYLKNVQHVIVNAEGWEKPVEQEQVGHHGTVNTRFNLLTAQGALNGEATSYDRKTQETTPIFESGKTYQITVDSYGFPTLQFEYTAP